MAVVRVLPAAAEAALGGPVPDGLEAHLAALSGCPRPQGIQLTSLLQALPPAILRAVGACGSSSGGEADTGDRLPPLVAAAVYELCDALEHFHWQAKVRGRAGARDGDHGHSHQWRAQTGRGGAGGRPGTWHWHRVWLIAHHQQRLAALLCRRWRSARWRRC